MRSAGDGTAAAPCVCDMPAEPLATEPTASPDPCPLFPLSCKYDQRWISKNSLGEGVLYNLESLTQVLEFRPGMRVLDLGCGKAISAIFLAREFGVEVWALDKQISATENMKRVIEMGCENKVFPLQLDARELPFPHDFFDAIIVVDSYHYFGTDEKYTPYICRFLKPHGVIGVVDICFTREINNLAEVPPYLRASYSNSWYFVHSPEWWRRFWDKTGLLRVETSELLPQNSFVRERYVSDSAATGHLDAFAQAISADNDDLIGFFRLIARRTEKAPPNDGFDN